MAQLRSHRAGHQRADSQGLRNRSRRGGSVLVIAAVGFVFICGCGAIAVDYGILVSDANRMQRACDAAVLAGVQELKKTSNSNADETRAKDIAARVAVENGARNVTASNVDIGNNGTRISLAASVTRSFFFARVLGQTSKSVTRRAAAVVGTAGSANSGPGIGRAAPIGITKETYEAYKDDAAQAVYQRAPVFRTITLIRQNKNRFGKDDFALFDLNDNSAKSPDKFRDQLVSTQVENTYLNDGSSCESQPLTCETTINAAQPAASNKLLAGMGELFQQATGQPWYDSMDIGPDESILGTKAFAAQSGVGLTNPRVMSLLITNSTQNPTEGVFNTPVLGYAPVYVQSIANSIIRVGNEEQEVFVLTVAFLGPITAEEGTPRSDDPDGDLSGLRVTSLVD